MAEIGTSFVSYMILFRPAKVRALEMPSREHFVHQTPRSLSKI